MQENEMKMIADALNGVNFMIEADTSYLNLLCGNDTALLDAAVIGRDSEGRVILTGTRVASGLEHELYDAMRLNELDKKWDVDGEALLHKLRNMTAAQRREIVLACAEAWENYQDDKKFETALQPRRIDGYLSRKVQAFKPGAMVYCVNEGTDREAWMLEEDEKEVVGLGCSFNAAKQAIYALRDASKA